MHNEHQHTRQSTGGKASKEAIMYKLYLVRTADRALYADEQILMGVFDSLTEAARVLGSQFQFCDVITLVGARKH